MCDAVISSCMVFIEGRAQWQGLDNYGDLFVVKWGRDMYVTYTNIGAVSFCYNIP